jgi:hypothetical protein
VREDRAAEFEKFYSATGSWAALFRDTQTPHRYVTIDRWDRVASHRLMRERLAKAYAAMDHDCEALTASERQIGVFEDPEIGFSSGRKCQRK